MVPIRCSIDVTFTMLPPPASTIQSAVWRDLQLLGKLPSTAPIPIATGAPTPVTIAPGVPVTFGPTT